MKLSSRQCFYLILSVFVTLIAFLLYKTPKPQPDNLPVLTDNTTEFMDKLALCYKYPYQSSDRYLCVKQLVDSIAAPKPVKNFEPVVIVPELKKK